MAVWRYHGISCLMIYNFPASLHYKATSIQALHKNTFASGGGGKYATTARGVTSAAAAAAPSLIKDFNHNTIPHPGHTARMGGGRKHSSSFNVTEELCEFQVRHLM